MTTEARRLSLADSLRLQVYVSAATAWLGVATPRRSALQFFVRRDLGARTFSFLAGLRDRYGSGVLWTWFPFHRTLLVLDAPVAHEVLRSPVAAPDAWLKERVLSRFVPQALVVTGDAATSGRRAFNVDVLDLHAPQHRHAAAFVAVATAEIDRLLSEAPSRLRFADFQRLAQRMTQRIVFGQADVESGLQGDLDRLLAWSNVGLRHLGAFRAFYRKLGSVLDATPSPDAACLAADATQARPEAATSAPTQVAFWMYVMKDAIELHVSRTLLLLAAHPEIQTRVRRELAALRTLDAQGIGGLALLEGCVLEQLRLWTPVPILLRRMAEETSIAGGRRLRRNDQTLVHAGFCHRDPTTFGPRADRFVPDAIVAGTAPPLLVFSVDPRGCAGRTLVLLIVKTTLALLLRDARYELSRPVIHNERIPYLCDHFAIELRRASAGNAPPSE